MDPICLGFGACAIVSTFALGIVHQWLRVEREFHARSRMRVIALEALWRAAAARFWETETAKADAIAEELMSQVERGE